MRFLIPLLTVLMLLLPSGAAAQIKLPSIKNGLIELALDQISTPGSFEITTGAIEDRDGGVTSLTDIRVSDGTGVWLTLEEVIFSWDPSAILSGELSITRLELIGLTVIRSPSEDAEPPVLKPSQPSGRGIFDWPRAPLALSIEGVRLERASIAEGVLPQAIRFDAEARAFDKGDLQELMLSLKRTDAVAGDIALTMRRDFAANTVKLDIAAAEAPGGIVAAAGGFPADAPARLSLTADGPPEDWRLIFDAAVERVFDAGGRATLAYADRLTVDADFSVTPGPELADGARVILGERATLRTQVVEQADGMFEVLSAELSSPALTLTASGAFASGAGESNLAVSLVALPALARLAEGVEFGRFSFDGRVTGPQGALAAEGRLALSMLATAAIDARQMGLEGRVAQTDAGLDFDLGGKAEGLRLDKLGPEVIGTATLAAAGVMEGHQLRLTRAALNSRTLTAEAAGTYDLTRGSGKLLAEMAAPEIAPVAAAYGAKATGRMDAVAEVALAEDDLEAELSASLQRFAMDAVAAERLSLAGTVRQTGGFLAFDLTGEGAGVALDQVPPDLTRELDLDARGVLADGTLALERLRLISPLVSVETSGSVALEVGTLVLDYGLKTAELAAVARAYGAEASGALEAGGQVEGSFAALRVAGNAGIAEAGFGGRSYGEVTLAHDVVLGDAPKGSLSLSSDGGALGAAEAKTRFRLEGSALALEELRAQVLGAALSGRALVNLDSSLIDGAADLSISDLSAIGRYLGARLGGSVTGRMTLEPSDGAQNLAADLAVSDFVTDGTSARRADLRLRAEDALGAPRIDVRIDGGGVDAGGIDLAAVRAEAKGPLERIAFSAGAEGVVGAEPLSASLAGQADTSGAVTAMTLASAEVSAGPDAVRLRQPLNLRVGGGSVIAKGLDLELPEQAVLAGDAAQHPGGFSGDLTLTRLPLALLQRWAAAPVTAGLLDLRAVFDTRRGRAAAKIDVQTRGMQFDKTQGGDGGLDLDLNSEWNGTTLDSRAELRGDFGDPMRARMTLPLRAGRGGIPQAPAGGAIDGALVWAGDLGDLWALIPAPGHILDGRADLDLGVGGTLDAPRVSGRADLTNGVYQNLDAGTILTDLTIRTTIAPDGTVNLALDSSDGAAGTVTSQAALRLGGGAPNLDVTVAIDRAVLVRRDDVTASLSGDLALAGPVTDLGLAGRLTVEKAEVRLVNTVPPEVVDLDGIRIKGAPEPDAGDGNGGALTLDLTVNAARNIFVRGRGLDSEWKTDLTVRGNADAPVVTGAIEKVRGRLDLLGRPFNLARGRIAFDGAAEIDPLIDVSLEREADGIRGGIVVEGRASAPEVRFASTPALPEEEVLPRLLFGQSRQSLTGAQAIQLAAGVATLMGGGAGPLDSVRSAAGLDVLRVDGESVDDASVTVGRNVADGVFVGARQGLAGQGSAVTVEVEVFDGVIVDTELGQEQGSNIGITLRHDF
jgi:autotransporter translocation and assembly factor TamB